jgi:hypothetical protein
MKECGQRAGQGQGNGKGRRPQPLLKLSDLGLTKTQSSRWQALAALSPEEQEAKIITVARCYRENIRLSSFSAHG